MIEDDAESWRCGDVVRDAQGDLFNRGRYAWYGLISNRNDARGRLERSDLTNPLVLLVRDGKAITGRSTTVAVAPSTYRLPDGRVLPVESAGPAVIRVGAEWQIPDGAVLARTSSADADAEPVVDSLWRHRDSRFRTYRGLPVIYRVCGYSRTRDGSARRVLQVRDINSPGSAGQLMTPEILRRDYERVSV